MNCATQAMKTF